MRDGVTLTDISVAFDEEVTLKYDWVGKAADGFPQLEGNAEEIYGKNFVIRLAYVYVLLLWWFCSALCMMPLTALHCLGVLTQSHFGHRANCLCMQES